MGLTPLRKEKEGPDKPSKILNPTRRGSSAGGLIRLEDYSGNLQGILEPNEEHAEETH